MANVSFLTGPTRDLVQDVPVITNAEPTEPGYSHLAARAIDFVRARGGCVAEDDLVAFVFGSSGSPKLWAPLLQRLLANDSTIQRQSDGVWSLAGSIVIERDRAAQ